MIRKSLNRYILLLLALPLLFACSSGRLQQNKKGLPFRVHLFNLSADSLHLSRLGIATSVPNDKIQFIKENDQYHAKFYLSLEIIDKNGENVVLRDFTKKLTLTNFKNTIKASPSNYYLGYFDLKPGDYKLSVKLMDFNSKSEGIYTREITLADYRDRMIRNSHILFTTRKSIEFDSLKSVTFDFSYKLPDSLFAYVQFVTKKPGHILDIQYEIRDGYEKMLERQTAKFELPQTRNQIFLPIRLEKLVGGRNFLIINFSYLDQKYSTKKTFYVSWGKYKNTQVVSKLSMRQLKIIADGKDIERIEEADPSIRDSLLAAYWKERDPTPETPQNELYDEFKQRVTEANQMFGLAREEGWNTDRGYIYIKYGPPDQVEKDIQGRDGFSRYEIWIFRSLRRRFIFYDRMGTGDYQLISQ